MIDRKNIFIDKAKLIHDNRYDYSLVNYKDNKTDINIICKIHGIFKQNPQVHLRGNGCSICSGNKRHTLDKFIAKGNEIHNNYYDYSLSKYKNADTNINIICPEHGVFEQTYFKHINLKRKCKKCADENNKFTKEEFIDRANKVHNFRYDYSNINYINTNSSINIKCLIHGEFTQRASDHVNKKNGCPHCKNSKGENIIDNFLINNNINYIRQKRFSDCKYKKLLRFDFYIPANNICIEFDGLQHFKSREFFGGIKKYDDLKIKDNIKNEYCKNNNINLIRISYKEINIIEDILFYLLKF